MPGPRRTRQLVELLFLPETTVLRSAGNVLHSARFPPWQQVLAKMFRDLILSHGVKSYLSTFYTFQIEGVTSIYLAHLVFQFPGGIHSHNNNLNFGVTISILHCKTAKGKENEFFHCPVLKTYQSRFLYLSFKFNYLDVIIVIERMFQTSSVTKLVTQILTPLT